MINKVITLIRLNIVGLYRVQSIVGRETIGSDEKLFNVNKLPYPKLSRKSNCIQCVNFEIFFVMRITVFRVIKE